MKVLFVSNDPKIFDATSAVRARMRAYAVLLGELHIVSVAGSGAREEQEGNLFLYPVHTWKFLRIRALTKQAHALILKRGIEVVSAQDPFEHGLAALRATQGTAARLHVQLHTDFLSPWFVRSEDRHISQMRMSMLNRSRRRIADRVLPAADGIRVVSERIRSSLIERYGARIVEPVVIPIAVDDAVPPPVRLPDHSFTFTLISVSRLEPEKCIADVLTALKLVVQQHPMTGLFVVGDGSERSRLEEMVRKLGLQDNVVFLGSRPDARGLMESAEAFIQASAYEGYGVTLVEAALAKVPIVTTDVGIVGEVFTGHKEVIAVPVGDPRALSLAITTLIEDHSVRQELPIHAEAAARAHLASVGDIASRVVLDFTRILQTLP